MLLKLCCTAVTLPSLGETEARSAGEQLAEGYLSRAVTDRTSGGAFGPHQPPSIRRYCPLMPQKTPARRAERIARWLSPANVVRISGKVWSYYPERAEDEVACVELRTGGRDDSKDDPATSPVGDPIINRR